jgi:hypothetical protein
MEELINYLRQFGQLTQPQITLIQSKAEEVKLKKDDYFSEAGKVSRRAAFVAAGVLSVWYINNTAEEITRYFIDENSFAVDLHSFSAQTPSSEYILAITSTRDPSGFPSVPGRRRYLPERRRATQNTGTV